MRCLDGQSEEALIVGGYLMTDVPLKFTSKVVIGLSSVNQRQIMSFVEDDKALIASIPNLQSNN
jgi:hypothetical protein